MNVQTLVSQLTPRLTRLGLVDPATGLFDRSEVEAYVGIALRSLANLYQLDHFLQINRELFRTHANTETYSFPDIYGFVYPEQTRRSGLMVSDADGTNPTNLVYYDPTRYNLLRVTTTGKPAWFTLADNLMYLSPIPDTIYVVEAVTKPVQDGIDIPEPYVLAVQIETLWRMASDSTDNERAQRALPLLNTEREKILRTLVNGEARVRQKFYTSYERPGFGRGRRRYGI